jgi:hypothetical protein
MLELAVNILFAFGIGIGFGVGAALAASVIGVIDTLVHR